MPATFPNWGGDEAVDVRELSEDLAQLGGRTVRCRESADGITQFRLDTTRRRELAGPCQVSWRDGVQRMVATRHPELVKAARP